MCKTTCYLRAHLAASSALLGALSLLLNLGLVGFLGADDPTVSGLDEQHSGRQGGRQLVLSTKLN